MSNRNIFLRQQARQELLQMVREESAVQPLDLNSVRFNRNGDITGRVDQDKRPLAPGEKPHPRVMIGSVAGLCASNPDARRFLDIYKKNR